jgi:maltose alpha-D-glucosyltransferase/alpha-amylase
MEDRFPILDIMEQTPQLDDSCQWALFLRNHDELTLEMVTDEERDYMYRAYAHEQAMRLNLGIRRRLAPLCANDRRTMELLNGLLFSMPGTPVLYYGDEIGMGDNVFLGDRNGVRTPMQWSADRNAGFSRANPQRLVLPIVIDPEYHYESVNVEAQQNNPRSLVWWMKRLITLRKQYQAFGRGTIEFLSPKNHRVLAFVREWEEETILIVANLSRFAQHVDLDLSRWRGMRPRELYGHTRFPAVGEGPYPLTLGGHGFYWFALERPRASEDDLQALTYEPPTVVARDPASLLRGEERPLLEEVLPGFLHTRRWFAGRERVVSALRIKEAVPIDETTLMLVEVTYEDDAEEVYMLPVALVSDNRWLPPQALVANVKLPEGEARLVDALEENRSSRALLSATLSGVTAAGEEGVITAGPLDGPAEPHAPEVELRNISPEHGSAALQYGDKYLLKVFRRVEEGVSPELEMARFLDRRTPGLTPHVVGAIEYRRDREEPITLAALQRYVPNEGTAWVQAREELRRFFERVLARDRQATAPPLPAVSIAESVTQEPPAVVREEMGSYLDSAAQIGRRTAALHLALAADEEDRAFSPEPYTALDLRSKYQSLRNLAGKTLRRMKDLLPQLHPSAQEPARILLDNESTIVRSFASLLGHRLTARRIRTHGDYHLGQVLFTGKDYVIIDFEGSRDRTLAERRRKRSALVDVAGMVRSFQFTAFGVLLDPSVVRDEDRAVLSAWAEHWHTWAAAAFVRGYLDEAKDAPFVPQALEQVGAVLDALTVERGFLELRKDLENPSAPRAAIPMRGLLRLLKLERPPLETAR